MKVKPHGAFFLLPVFIFSICFTIAIYILSTSVIPAFSDVKVLESDQQASLTLTQGSFVSIFINNDNLVSYTVTTTTNGATLEYQIGTTSYNAEIIVTNHSGSSPTSGFDLDVFADDEYFEAGDYINFLDINITSNDDYEISFNYDDEVTTMGYSALDFTGSGSSLIMVGSLIIGGVGGAILSFIIIILMRSSSKKKLRHNNYQPIANNDSTAQYYNATQLQEQKEFEENKKDNDYDF